MPYTYESDCEHLVCVTVADSMADAIRMAVAHFESGTADPIKILGPDNTVLWERGDLFTTGKTLRALAKKHGVRQPCWMP